MSELAVIIIVMFLHFDVALLKRKAGGLFSQAFRMSLAGVSLWMFMVLSTVLADQSQRLALLAVLALVAAGVYAVRRSRLLADLAVVEKMDPEKPVDAQLELALKTFPLLSSWVILLLGAHMFMALIQDLTRWKFDELTIMIVMTQVSSILFLFLLFGYVRQIRGLSLFDVLGLETKGLGTVKVWVIPGVFAFAFGLVATHLLGARPAPPITPLQEILANTTSLETLAFFVLAAILTAPFFEEVIFRGFFFHVIKPFGGVVFAVLLVSLTFGYLHMDQYRGDWLAIFLVGTFGTFLTLLRAMSGSSVPGMVAHYVFNASMIVIPMVMILFSNAAYLDYQVNFYRLTSDQKQERLQKSIQDNPEFSPAYNDLAWLYAEEGRELPQALELIGRALEMDPDNPAYLDTKAEILFKMGEVDSAITIEEQLKFKYPHDRIYDQQLQKFRKTIDAK